LLVNLLDNASKHTPEGSAIELSARRDETALVLEVADRGPGLPTGGEQLVFERFFRGTQGGTGVGLGLAVCRGIATAHAGTIEAENRAGGGAVFRVRIPDAAIMPRFDDAPAVVESP
jgi:two-component system sensor histidine kinase KdpD